MLGGQIRVAAAGPTREELLDFVYFLERGLRRLDVDVRLGSEATRENVRGLRAYFDVADINGGATRVRELGGKASEPMPVPSMGWFVTCTDPHGNESGLWQTEPSAPTPER